MKYAIALLVGIFIAVTAQAELVKAHTKGSKTFEGAAIIEFDDSARIFPFEPVYGKWRLTMWVGFIDTVDLQGDTLMKKDSRLYGSLTFKHQATLLQNTKPTFVDDDFGGMHPDKKKIVFYLYIPDEAIYQESRMEWRLEQVLKAKKKKRPELFKKYVNDFGFIDAILIEGRYNMLFAYDSRSPQGIDDFRLLLFTDSAKKVVAVAHEGYRQLKLKAKSQGELDRRLTIYYLVNIPQEDKEAIKTHFYDAYHYRD